MSKYHPGHSEHKAIAPKIRGDIDYIKIFRILFSRWYWVAGAMLVAFVCAKAYLWYTPPLFSADASLKFEDSRPEISELLNIKTRFYRQDKTEAEKYIIQSRGVILRTLATLDYRIAYYLENSVKRTELYPKKPLQIAVLKQAKKFFNDHIKFEHLDEETFLLSYRLLDKHQKHKMRYGDVISLPGLSFKISHRKSYAANPVYLFKFNTKDALFKRINDGLTFDENRNTGILHIKLRETNPYFAADALNALVQEYLEYDQTQKSAAAVQTIAFVDTLLLEMQQAVERTGKAMAEFKMKNDLFDISSLSEAAIAELSRLETERQHLDIQQLRIANVEKSISKTDESGELNYNIQGLADPQLADLLQKYNDALMRRGEILMFYKIGSKAVKKTDDELLLIRSALLQNIEMQRMKNLENRSYIANKIEQTKAGYHRLPSAERDFIGLKSAFDVNQKVLNYLSEKKLEAQISKAAALPAGAIVDKAMPPDTVLAPKPARIYTFAFAAGLSGGLLMIFGSRALNPFIYDQETIENLTDTPIIGVIVNCVDSNGSLKLPIPAISHPKSAFSESVRSVRTNLSFLASEKRSKVICITSEVSGEGKSFIAVNLAGTLSLTEHKVIVIATDLRKSKLHWLFRTPGIHGLSDYLAGKAQIEDVIQKTGIEHLSIIPSGSIPPNPAELLLRHKMKDLLDKLRGHYDFIILDTAPVGLVSDGLPLIRMADINLFVIRSGISGYQSAALPGKLKDEFGLSDMAIILNSTKKDNLYGRYAPKEYGRSQYYFPDAYGKEYDKTYYTENVHKKWWEL